MLSIPQHNQHDIDSPVELNLNNGNQFNSLIMCVRRIEDAAMRSKTVGSVDLPCAQSAVVEMNENFAGYNVTLPVRVHTQTHLMMPNCIENK